MNGTIVSKAKKPVAGVQVTWQVDTGGDGRGMVDMPGQESVYSGTDGSYTIVALPPGKYALSFAHGRFIDHSEKGVEVEDGDTRKLDVTLDPGLSISGVVKGPDDKPYPGARVRLRAPKLGVWERENTDEQGRFEFRGLAKGGYTVTAQGDGVAPTDGDRSVRAGAKDIVLRLEQAFEIAGSVVFDDGRPVPNALVEAAGKEGQPSVSNRTGTDGAFVLRPLTAGEYTLRVKPGWGRPSERPNLVPIEIPGVVAGTMDVRVEVRAGLSVTGTVVRNDGSQAQNGWVHGSAIDAEGQRDPTRPGNVQGSVSDGRLVVQGLEPGRYRLNVRSGNQMRSIDVDAGETDVRIEFGETGSVAGRLARADGGSTENARVNVWGPHGGNWAVVKADGTYEMVGLSAGMYSVRAQLEADGKQWKAERSEVEILAGGRTPGIDLMLTANE